MNSPKKLRIAVLASGRGSNLQAIIDAVVSNELNAEIVAVISDKPGAFALERARKAGIKTLVVEPKGFKSRDEHEKKVVSELKAGKTDIVCLAGYMRIVGQPLLNEFKGRIVNIHPALLPSFPGLHAQKQALEHGVKISGCTVHFVDEGMDTGPIIVQTAVPVLEHDTEGSLSERILEQEHRTYVEALKLIADGRVAIEGRRVKVSSPHEK